MRLSETCNVRPYVTYVRIASCVLEDADFALESARLAKNQVLQQAGTSMLSQANQMNQLVMELLRG